MRMICMAHLLSRKMYTCKYYTTNGQNCKPHLAKFHRKLTNDTSRRRVRQDTKLHRASFGDLRRIFEHGFIFFVTFLSVDLLKTIDKTLQKWYNIHNKLRWHYCEVFRLPHSNFLPVHIVPYSNEKENYHHENILHPTS
jgi:hypothetical protein